jgi:serine-type D-Ala-D-Ala carboxypeptidase (penicillin-binding protein 5/6)
MKTGHTDSAGFCLVTSAKREDMRVVAVVLGSTSIKGREDASAALLNYGFTFYETVNVKQRGTPVLKPRVYQGGRGVSTVSGRGGHQYRGAARPGRQHQTTASVRAAADRAAQHHTRVGELQVVVNGKPVTSVPLYPLADVPRGRPVEPAERHRAALVPEVAARG